MNNNMRAASSPSTGVGFGLGGVDRTIGRNDHHHHRGRARSPLVLSMIFERMSEQCIAALITAQEQASKIGQNSVGTELMTAGIVYSPENARRTLNKYGITFRKVQRTIADMYEEETEEQDSGKAFAGMFNRNQKARNVELPFTPELKRALTNAERVADRFDSPFIASEHVLLSLLQYEEDEATGKITAAELDVETDSADGALAVFLLTEGLDGDSFSASVFCRELTNALRDGDDDGNQELVGAGKKKGDDTPTLSECGIDLTEQAENDQLDKVHGRDEEILMALRTLVRRRKNNPCLIGEPGVGKTAIAEGIAQILAAPKMVVTAKGTFDRDEDGNIVPEQLERFQNLQTLAKQCPPKLASHRVISLELATLVAGTKYRGEFEERLQSIVNELTAPDAPPTILFLDEIHTLVGAGSAEGGIDAANMLKPALARGKLQVIGATTISEYRKHIEKDAALERRLQPLMVKEPSVERSVDILTQIKKQYELHHDVAYTEEAIEACVKLSERYITDRFLPDKAIDLLDEAGASVHLAAMFAAAADDGTAIPTPAVTEHDIAAVISQWNDIPIGKLEQEESSRLLKMEDELTVRVKGQSRAVKSVARAVKRARSGLRDVSRPVASFLFAGPTGVGKTELCKTLAETYFGSEKDMIRMDMSEYMEKHSVSRLVGPPPGYIGYEEGGQLTEAVRRAPHSVVLLDEVEKGHPDVLNILLQIMEDGILTDGKGRTVNFKNVILVMTSNVGSKQILQVVNKRAATKEADLSSSNTFKTNGSASSSMTPSSPSSSMSMDDPPRPEEVLSKLQASPEAMALMMEASRDSEIMGAMQTALGGSPADLMRIAQSSPKVADFLTRLWDALGMRDEFTATSAAPANGSSAAAVPEPTNDPIQSGLDSVRGVMDNWSKTADNSFTSGLVQQLQGMLPNNNDDEDKEEVVAANGDDAQYRSSTLEEEARQASEYSEMSDVVKEELEDSFKPELLNRIDEIIVFAPLGGNDLVDIARFIVSQTVDRAVKERDVYMEVGPQLIQKIVEEGSYNAAQFGARPMRRAVQRHFEDTVSEAIIRGFLTEGDESVAELDSSDENSVLITRKRDGESIVVAVEDANGGIGMAPSSANSRKRDDALETDAVVV